MLALQTSTDVCIHLLAGLSPYTLTCPLQSTLHCSSKTQITLCHSPDLTFFYRLHEGNQEEAPLTLPGTPASLQSEPLSSLIFQHFSHTHLSSSHMELLWWFPELFHTLVPSSVLLPALEDQPSSLSYSFRKPSLMLPISSGCPSSCSSCTSFHCCSTEHTIS